MKLACVIEQVDTAAVGCPSAEEFERWITHVLAQVSDLDQAVPIEIGIRLVDKQESAELNSAFRKKTGPTNILSFPYNESPAGLPVYLLGDLVICAPLVAEEAHQQNKPLLAHWAHLTVHGTLHLLGYDHIADDDAADMEALEIELLSELGFANPYAIE